MVCQVFQLAANSITEGLMELKKEQEPLWEDRDAMTRGVLRLEQAALKFSVALKSFSGAMQLALMGPGGQPPIGCA